MSEIDRALYEKDIYTAEIVVTTQPDLSGDFICNGSADEVDINKAISYLNSVRAWKEKVVLKGNFNIDDEILLPSYTILEIIGRIRASDAFPTDNDDSMITNDDHTDGNIYIEVRGGIIDGNRAGRSAALLVGGYGIRFNGSDGTECTRIKVVGVTIIDQPGQGLQYRFTDESMISDIQLYDNGTAAQNVYHGVYIIRCDNIFMDKVQSFNELDHDGFRIRYVTGLYMTELVGSGNDRYGINIADEADGVVVTNSGFNTNGDAGIYLAGADVTNIILAEVIANYNLNSAMGGFTFGSNINITMVNCEAKENQGFGLQSTSNSYLQIIGGEIMNNNQGVAGRDGIRITSYTDVLIMGVNISDDQTGAETQINGIRATTGGDRLRVINCTFNNNDQFGVRQDVGDYNTYIGNMFYSNGESGLRITDGDYAFATSNRFIENGIYGVDISVGVLSTVVQRNRYSGNISGPIRDLGTGTILDVLLTQFTQLSGAAVWVDGATANPSGIDIDDAGDRAVARIPLPLELHRVIRFKVWGYSNVDEAVNNMLLRIVVWGGGSSEGWDTEVISVANHPSEETGGIAINDVIHWMIDSSNDTDIADLRAGDYLQIMLIGSAAAAPDIATDALFGGIEIEYV